MHIQYQLNWQNSKATGYARQIRDLTPSFDPRKKDSNETAQNIAEKLEALLADRFLQIGGNETVGQGWCCVKVNGGQS